MLGAVPSYGAYYRFRPPPPKPHYGPKPPPSHLLHKPNLRRPTHGFRPPVRPPLPPPRSSYMAKPTPPPPVYTSTWKTRFSAPVVKEPFPSIQNDYLPQSHFRDDEKGPIHTIPAPNLGPSHSDELAAVFKHGQRLQSNPTEHYQV